MTAFGNLDGWTSCPLWKEATLAVTSLGGPLDIVADPDVSPTMGTRDARFRVLFIGAVCHRC